MTLREALGMPDDCKLEPCWSDDGKLFFECDGSVHYGWMIMPQDEYDRCQKILDRYLAAK